MVGELSNSQIRQWILADEYLYLWARQEGGGGDEEMYAHLSTFIEQNREALVTYIQQRLEK